MKEKYNITIAILALLYIGMVFLNHFFGFNNLTYSLFLLVLGLIGLIQFQHYRVVTAIFFGVFALANIVDMHLTDIAIPNGVFAMLYISYLLIIASLVLALINLLTIGYNKILGLTAVGLISASFIIYLVITFIQIKEVSHLLLSLGLTLTLVSIFALTLIYLPVLAEKPLAYHNSKFRMELEELDRLYEMNIINETEYNFRKDQILSKEI